MNGWSEAKITQDSIRMLFPESWQFWVPLHSQENRNHVSMRDSWALLMDRPPFIERLVWVDIKTLLWGGSFRKCIRHIRPIDNKVFSRCNPIEDSRASLIHTVSSRTLTCPDRVDPSQVQRAFLRPSTTLIPYNHTRLKTALLDSTATGDPNIF